MRSNWDAVVIGAGPAGISFAAEAAGFGLDVLVLDEQDTPGGQIYRNAEGQSRKTLSMLGPDYRHGVSLIRAFRDSRAEYFPGSTVWKIEADGRLCYSNQGESREIRAKRIVIATGAMERPVPFPGWTLPGVMGVGAADTLLKSAGMVADGPVAMVGNGPLMLSAAIHLAELGVEVSHFLETKPLLSGVNALSCLPRALTRTDYLLKGVSMLAKTMHLAGQFKTGITDFAVEGDDRVEALSYTRAGKRSTIAVGTVLVHEGIIPRSEFARQLGLDHDWDPVQRFWYPRLDPFGRTSCPNVYIAGDGAFVHGAVAAELKGRLAAIDIAAELSAKSGTDFREMAATDLKALKRELAPRPFVDKTYQPRENLYALDDDTLVCRCEEVTAQQIRTAVLQGMTTPEMVKSLTRCGMGPCQSRMCSASLAEVIAKETGRMVTELSPISTRPPVRNLPVGEFTRMVLLEEGN
ncbi:MAG: FAD-dependent oxidoreductase [Desulfobacterales bacterium]|nr:FAD-dependent oxidoreductase [Desulfobacterales bacterium]